MRTVANLDKKNVVGGWIQDTAKESMKNSCWPTARKAADVRVSLTLLLARVFMYLATQSEIRPILPENSKAIVLSGYDEADLDSCPNPSFLYKEDGKWWISFCCCGEEAGCCWGKCTWPKPPEDCLKGVKNSQWVFNTDKIYWQAVKNYKSQGFKFLIFLFHYSHTNR